MSLRTISSCFILAAFAVASCTVGVEEGPLVQDDPGPLGEGENVASTGQSLTKGTVGAVNGDADYCNDLAHPCASGEGDCDSSVQCSPGLGCVADIGANFGFPPGWDICVPTHCGNKVQDGGETGVDCGGTCGACIANCAGTAGGQDFCVGCKCASGGGDCDSNAQCQTGLTCGADNGPNFGYANGFDVCVPPHCVNGVQDAGSGETGVDTGGPCGTAVAACVGTPGAANFCVGCKCASGQGDCDSSSECGTGLVCGSDNGPKFDLPTGYDVCVAPHCVNGIQDGGETAVDTGGGCSTGVIVVPPPARNVFFSEYAEGSVNSRALEIYNAGTETQSCVVNMYFSGATTVGASITLSAPIASGALFVLCRSGGTITTPCTMSSAALTFNGDDAVELVCGGVTQDIVGQIGLDPGTRWGTPNTSTADNTLRRKCSVTTGDTVGSDVFTPSTQWDGFALGDFSNLGVRSCP